MATASVSLPDDLWPAVLAHLPLADPTTISLLGEGVATRAYALSAGPDRWVVRISTEYPEPWTWRGGRRYEVPVLVSLSHQGLPVPEQAHVLLTKGELPVAIIERHVAGSPLTAVPRPPSRDPAPSVSRPDR